MKNLLLFLFIMLILVAGITPFADGYLAKHEFMKQIERSQAFLNSQQSPITIEVLKYDMGWIKSVVSVNVSGKAPSHVEGKPDTVINIPIDLVIQHGPIILIDSKPVIALANVTGSLHLPREMQDKIPNGVNISLNMSSIMTLDQRTTTTTFSIPAITIGPEVKWDGLTGESVVEMDGHKITSAKSTVKLGSISGKTSPFDIKYQMDPITSDMTVTYTDDNNSSTIVSVKSGSINLDMMGKSAAKLKSFSMNGNNNVQNGMYNSQFDFIANDFNAPTLAPVNSIPSIKYYANVSNLNYNNLKKLSVLIDGLEKKYTGQYKSDALSKLSDEDSKKIQETLLNIINAKSSIETTLNLDTNLGKSSMLLKFWLNDSPKKIDDLTQMVDAKLEVRLSKQLVNTLMELYMTQVMASQMMHTAAQELPPPVDPKNSGKNIFFQGVADMVKDNAITPDQSITVMALADQHITTEADLDAALTKLALTKEISEKVKAAFISQYMPKTSMPAIETPVDPNKDNPTVASKAMIDSWMQQGYMIDDGDAYSISYSKSGNDMKLNGSTDNPVLEPVRSIFSGEALRTYQSAQNQGKQTNEILQLTQGIAAAVDSLAQSDGSFNNKDVTQTNIEQLMPLGKMSTPSGTNATISNQTQTGYTITMTNISQGVCKQLKARLSNSPKYVVTSNCESTEPADFIYQYDSLK